MPASSSRTGRGRSIRAPLACSLLLAGGSCITPLHAAENTADQSTQSGTAAQPLSLGAISVSAPAFAYGTEVAEPYAGGLVAPGVNIGVWGQKQSADVPFSIVGFTDKLVRNQQADTVADVLLNSAAVQTGSGYGNYAERYMIRGFVLNGDDISFAGLYGIVPRQLVSTQFLERVELFKGASAFTNGIRPAGAGVGGAVNLVPKTAREGELTRLRYGYATESHAEAAVDFSRRYGQDERFGVRVNLLHGQGEIGIEHEDRRETSAAVALDYQGDRGHAMLFLAHQNMDNQGGRLNVRPAAGLTSIPDTPDSATNYTPEWSHSDMEVTFGLLRGGYDLTDNWTAYGAVGANQTEESGQYSSLTLLNNAGDAIASRLGVPYESNTITGQAGLRGQLLTGPVSHQVNIAYSTLYRRFDTAFTFASPAGPNTNIYDPADVAYPATMSQAGDLDDPNIRGRVRSSAFALSDTLGFFDDRLLVTLGLRYQDIEIKNYEYNGDLDETLSDDTLTPIYGVVYKPWEHVSLYANHIEALQPGETAPNTAANQGQSIGIAESSQNEVGIKYDSRAFGATLSLYSIEKPGAFIDPVSNVYGYYGEQRNRGVEVSLYGEPIDGLRLLTSATWIDAELTQTLNGVNEGNRAIGVPEYRLVLGGEWDIPNAERWTVTGQIVHNGPQYADAANQLKLDSWTRLDLGVRYVMPLGDNSVTWRANVENVTDADYWTKASEPAGYLNLSEPRTFKLSATINF